MTKVLALLLILFAATPTAGITENNTQQLTADEINENFKSISRAGSSYNQALIFGGISIGFGIVAAFSDNTSNQNAFSFVGVCLSIASFGEIIKGNNHLRNVSYKELQQIE